MKQSYQIFPVGMVHKDENKTEIEIYDQFTDALLGLETFSHIIVLYWFHNNDTPKKRATLQVHPRKNKANPLTGVFGTHSPVRPNLIAISTCKIRSIADNRIRIDDIDAVDGTPVIDIKSYIPHHNEPNTDIKLPDWV
jgi:tRNA-Thr(GGU) m(6)t(6)A37 methyltransferase TsaA